MIWLLALTEFDADIWAGFRSTIHRARRMALYRPAHAQVDHQIMFYGVGVKAGVMPVSKEQMYLLLVANEPGNPWMPPDRLDRLLRERCCPSLFLW
jgi:hypothetical protein